MEGLRKERRSTDIVIHGHHAVAAAYAAAGRACMLGREPAGQVVYEIEERHRLEESNGCGPVRVCN